MLRAPRRLRGERTSTYRDVLGIPTVCVGEAKGIRMGMAFTQTQCEAMLLKRLVEDFAPAMERCVSRPMGDDVNAAFLSLSYNIGSGGFYKSSVARLFDKGGKSPRVIAGLAKRRQAERALCL